MRKDLILRKVIILILIAVSFTAHSQTADYNSSDLKGLALFPEDYTGKSFSCKNVKWKPVLDESLSEAGYYKINICSPNEYTTFDYNSDKIESVVQKPLAKKLLANKSLFTTEHDLFGDWFIGNIYGVVKKNGYDGFSKYYANYFLIISKIEYLNSAGQIIEVYEDSNESNLPAVSDKDKYPLEFSYSLSFLEYLLIDSIPKIKFDTIKSDYLVEVGKSQIGEYNPETKKHDIYTYEYEYMQYFSGCMIRIFVEFENDDSIIKKIKFELKGNYSWFDKAKEISSIELKPTVNYYSEKKKFENDNVLVYLFENNSTEFLSITISKNNK